VPERDGSLPASKLGVLVDLLLREADLLQELDVVLGRVEYLVRRFELGVGDHGVAVLLLLAGEHLRFGWLHVGAIELGLRDVQEVGAQLWRVARPAGHQRHRRVVALRALNLIEVVGLTILPPVARGAHIILGVRRLAEGTALILKAYLGPNGNLDAFHVLSFQNGFRSFMAAAMLTHRSGKQDDSQFRRHHGDYSVTAGDSDVYDPRSPA
jgi:hypothetical protein